MNSCYGNSLKLFASLVKFVELHASEKDYHLLKYYLTKGGHSYKTSMSWSMYQSAETVASNDENSPEVNTTNSW